LTNRVSEPWRSQIIGLLSTCEFLRIGFLSGLRRFEVKRLTKQRGYYDPGSKIIVVDPEHLSLGLFLHEIFHNMADADYSIDGEAIKCRPSNWRQFFKNEEEYQADFFASVRVDSKPELNQELFGMNPNIKYLKKTEVKKW